MQETENQADFPGRPADRPVLSSGLRQESPALYRPWSRRHQFVPVASH